MTPGFSPRLPFGLYALCDDQVRPDLGLPEKARLLLEGGTPVLQLRMKQTNGRAAIRAAREVVALCRAAGAVCLVNDRPDVALLAGADGVHLGADDFPLADARSILGQGMIIGATVRSGESARCAASEGASYVGVGPVFATASKQVGFPPMGIVGLRQVVEASPVPVVAIAGVGLANIEQVALTGVHGAAVLSELLNAVDIAEKARELGRAFERGRTRRNVKHG